jgi:hypothetical protein
MIGSKLTFAILLARFPDEVPSQTTRPQETLKAAQGILYLSCTDPVLILYYAGCFWLDFQGVLKILFTVPFPTVVGCFGNSSRQSVAEDGE